MTEPYLIDRIAAIAALKGCQVLLCLNKCDLNTADELYDIYSHSALPVLRISAETGEGLAALRAAIAGKLNAFTGNSGVGKSSVLNRLLPELHLPVGEVSKALGRRGFGKAWPRPPHHAPCGAVCFGRRHLCDRHTGFFLL